MSRLLIDADIVAFQAASAAEEVYLDETGDILFWGFKYSVGEQIADNLIDKITDALNWKGEVLLCFSCPTKEYFRHDIYSEYKSNRGTNRPLLGRTAVTDYLMDNYVSAVYPKLEGDDVVGMLAQEGDVMVSEDKDLRTVPGLHFNPAKDTEVVEVSQEEADRFFYAQALAGDMTDGYPGCPQVGLEGALKVVDSPFVFEAYEHVFKSGPRKGLSETRFKKNPTDSIWESIVSHYEKAGLSEEYALQMARCARILRRGEYSEEEGVKLWSPK